MRWTKTVIPPEPPRAGDLRKRHIFLWWPRTLKLTLGTIQRPEFYQETRWLEMATIEEVYIEYWGDYRNHSHWRFNRFTL